MAIAISIEPSRQVVKANRDNIFVVRMWLRASMSYESGRVEASFSVAC
jgi:hypothetical protein